MINRNGMNKAGASLLAVVGAIVLLSLLAASVLMLVASGTLEGVRTSMWSEAFTAAETGISMAKADMATNTSWTSSVPYTLTGAIGKAGFSVEVNSTSPPCAILTSTGVRGDSMWTSVWTGILAEADATP
jgi:hypothetical protein